MSDLLIVHSTHSRYAHCGCCGRWEWCGRIFDTKTIRGDIFICRRCARAILYAATKGAK